MQIGFKLAAEAFGPNEPVRQAVRAEAVGFDFVEMSDHFHPWLDNQNHSPFTWTVLGTIAARTERIGLATGVTCPMIRYHPAIIAQAAATTALLSDGRFTLGIGSGERLNEQVLSELPNPANFAAATTTVRVEDMLDAMVCGSDPKHYVDAVREAVEAGYDRVVLMNAGPDMDAFLDFFHGELNDLLRAEV